ncbi:MAG: hypothetical protein RLZZ59_748 [Pseudomonadota bacterium]|jgi:NADH dehydrogenase [ubiquinone] 1 alpha subcomplex assembly factor 7
MLIESKIRSSIEKKGFVTFDEAIAVAMYASEDSYYRKNKAIGPKEDFLTAPEVSQLFGEMIGVWIAESWEKMGGPEILNIIEFGSGLGTLLRDALRVLSKQDKIYKAIRIWIIDVNPKLIQEQKNSLKNFPGPIKWILSIDQVPSGPSIILANEFFDALPVKQYFKDKKEWKEKVLIIDPNTGYITFDTRPIKKAMSEYLTLEHIEAGDGAVFEESPESIKVMQSICRHIRDNIASALIIDYGYEINPRFRKEYQYTSTTQAVKGHKYVPLLEGIRGADISSHVDFWALKKVAYSYSVNVCPTLSQRKFLSSCGIGIRLNSLINKNPKDFDLLMKQYDRLTAIDQMGELFKVICITSDPEIVTGAFYS